MRDNAKGGALTEVTFYIFTLSLCTKTRIRRYAVC